MKELPIYCNQSNAFSTYAVFAFLRVVLSTSLFSSEQKTKKVHCGKSEAKQSNACHAQYVTVLVLYCSSSVLIDVSVTWQGSGSAQYKRCPHVPLDHSESERV